MNANVKLVDPRGLAKNRPPEPAAQPAAPLRIRCSLLPEFNDCARRASIETLYDQIIAMGYELRFEDGVAIAPTIGKALHAGTEVDLKTKLQTGDLAPFKDVLDAAIAEFRKEIRDGCDYDSLSPTANTAERQIERQLLVYHSQVAPDIQPESVELPLKADAGNGFVLTGHWDVREVTERVHDAKGGADTYPAAAQLGGYILLGNANGRPVTSVVTDFVQRVSVNKPQPPAKTVAYDAAFARRYAVATIKRIKRDVTEFLASGDVEILTANPNSPFCTYNLCPARATKFCKAWRR